MVKKGIILSIEGNKAKVAPADDIDMVSGFYDIPPHLRVDDYTAMANAIVNETGLKTALQSIAAARQLKKGDQVAFVSFSDCTGAILAKL